MTAMFSTVSHLHQLHEVLKVLLLVDGELAVVVDDAIVLHFAVTADAQGIIARIVGALPHQEQTCLWRVKQPLGLLPSYLPMKPTTGREERRRIKVRKGRGEANWYVRENW